MDAWGVLTDNSTITSGDAWEHLNSQGSGDGGETVVYVSEAVSSNIDTEIRTSMATSMTSGISSTTLSSNINTDIKTGKTT